MSGTLPQSPAFSSLEVASVQRTFVSRSISGRRQTRQTHGQYFKLSAKFPPMTRAQFAPINAFIMSQRGQYESFQVIPPVINAGQAPTQSTDATWQPSQTVIEQNILVSTSGSGSDTKFSYTTSSASTPVLTITGIPRAGEDFAVSDTIVIRDYGSTSNVATLTVASVTSGGGIISFASTTPSTVYGGAPKVNGASQTGRSVITNGWNASVVSFKAGDFAKFANHDKIYTVISDVIADSNGNATITIEPALITSPADQSLLTLTAVPFTVALTGRVQEFETGTTGLYEYELDMEEVI